MPAKAVNDNTFDNDVLHANKPVLVDFWAPWCGPCRAMSGIVDEVANELGDKASVVKVNIDEASESTQKYDVHSIPTFVVIRDGQEQQRLQGVVPKAELVDAMNSQIG